MKLNSKKYKGLTLIETLVYLGLFAIIFFAIMQYLINTQILADRLKHNQYISQYEAYIVSKLDQEFGTIVDVNEAVSAFDSDNGTLVYIDADGVTNTINVNEGILYISSPNTIAISNSRLSVTKFNIKNINNYGSEVESFLVTLSFYDELYPDDIRTLSIIGNIR